MVLRLFSWGGASVCIGVAKEISLGGVSGFSWRGVDHACGTWSSVIDTWTLDCSVGGVLIYMCYTCSALDRCTWDPKPGL